MTTLQTAPASPSAPANKAASPKIKLEHSSTASSTSVASGALLSLMQSTAASASMTAASLMDNAMTPPASLPDMSVPASPSFTVAGDESVILDDDMSIMAPDFVDTKTEEADGKKSTKKRKSWGQVLPEPKTSLPPRKRAKTEDEKEQRRVERVLRNRRAAQSSRERKRQEVEALEKTNQELADQNALQQQHIATLLDELNKLRSGTTGPMSRGPMSRGSSPLLDSSSSHKRHQSNGSITLSQPLFATHIKLEHDLDDFGMVSPGASPQSSTTIDPSSLSPTLEPELNSSSANPAKTSTKATTSSTDETQHPAAVLCDQQCPSEEEPWLNATWMWQLQLRLQLQLLLTTCSTLLSICQRPMKLVSGALARGLALHPTPWLMSYILWMVTLPTTTSPTQTSTSASSSTMMLTPLLSRPNRQQPQQLQQQRPLHPRPSTSSTPLTPLPQPCLTLRLRSLQKLLTSSPGLARPLEDATTACLRFVSEEGREDWVSGPVADDDGLEMAENADKVPFLWPQDAELPSREVLLTLLWAIRVEALKMAAVERKPGENTSSASVRQGVDEKVAAFCARRRRTPGLSVPLR